MAPPTTYTDVREFTGDTGFYRRFIKGYSQIAKPLNDLLSGETSHLKNKPVVLTPEAISAFEQLKMKCLQAPVPQFANFNRPFLLETDASGDGLETKRREISSRSLQQLRTKGGEKKVSLL